MDVWACRFCSLYRSQREEALAALADLVNAFRHPIDGEYDGPGDQYASWRFAEKYLEQANAQRE